MTTSKTDLEGSIQEHDEQIDKKATQEDQNTKDYVRKVLTNTSFKYLGISFLLTYHYILWFIPDSFFGTELLNDQVTEAWLVNLLAGSITMLFTAFLIKRGGHISPTTRTLHTASQQVWRFVRLPCNTCQDFCQPICRYTF